MFTGRNEHSVDTKGRIIMPAKYRDELTEEFVVTISPDGCLYAYPPSEWEIFAEQLRNLPGTAEARRLQRFLTSHAANVEMDKQGRCLIPQHLRDAVGISKDVMTIGSINKLEIWDKTKFDEIDLADDLASISDSMASFGLKY